MHPENEPQTPVNTEPQNQPFNPTSRPQTPVNPEFQVQQSAVQNIQSPAPVATNLQPQSPIDPTPQQPVANYPGSPAQPQFAEDPGKDLGTAGIVFAFFIPLAGLILSIVAKNKSKKAGFDGKTGSIGLVISIITLILTTIINIFIIAMLYSAFQESSDYGAGSTFNYGAGSTFDSSNVLQENALPYSGIADSMAQ